MCIRDSTITLSLPTTGVAAGTTLSGTTTATVSGGVATFSTLSLNKVNTGLTLVATSGTTNYGPTPSAAFNVAVGAPTHLVFTTQPTTVTHGAAIAPAVQVAIEDVGGNVETGDSTSTITLTIGTNPGSGTLSGTTTATVSAGVATFSTLSITNPGVGYTLVANSGSTNYGPATSAAFTVTPGASTQLAFVTQPTNATAGVTMGSVQVAIEDASGNVETSDATSTITLSLPTTGVAAGTTLSGTTTATVSAGVATFSTLSLNKVNTGLTLVANSGTTNYGPTPSAAFNLSLIHISEPTRPY